MKTKYCSKCKKKKSHSEFHQDKRAKSGLSPWCKGCRRKYYQKYYKVEKPQYDRIRLLKKYDLTVEQHKQIYVNQNGCCALCGIPVSYDKIHTDHNHQTNQVRELLCPRCNIFVGFIENNSELVQPVLKYLKEHNGKSS